MKTSTFISLLFHQIFLCSFLYFPVLRDTLLLIERQSGALETQTEDLFSSILSAMDGLTQPKPIQQNKKEDQSPVGGHGSIF